MLPAMPASSTVPRPPDPATIEAGPAAIVLTVSVVACAGLLGLVFGVEVGDAQGWVRDLPLLNGALNAGSFLALVIGVRAIRRGDRDRHRRWMLTAFGLSAAFLVSYLTYHTLAGDTPFVGPAVLRVPYLVLLASHVLASVAALPLVLGTLAAALVGREALHRRLTRATVPLWSYVSITGVLVVLALRALGS